MTKLRRSISSSLYVSRPAAAGRFVNDEGRALA
jgi:hypothetical protein